jgi:hypothetical protein
MVVARFMAFPRMFWRSAARERIESLSPSLAPVWVAVFDEVWVSAIPVRMALAVAIARSVGW